MEQNRVKKISTLSKSFLRNFDLGAEKRKLPSINKGIIKTNR